MVAQRVHDELAVHKSIIHTVTADDILLGFSTSSPSAFQTRFPDKTDSLGSYDLSDSFCLGSPLCTYMINDQGVLTSLEKLEMLLNWPHSNAWKDWKCFIGQETQHHLY
jgi:hypothetical protein